MTPNDAPSESSARNSEALCSCGATTRSPKSDQRCSNGHLLRGNQAASITGHHGKDFRDKHGAEIEAKADHFARDAGYRSLKVAPLGFQIAAIALARTATIGDLAYWRMLEAGGPLSESGKPRRAYSIWADTNRDLARDLKGARTEVVAARPPSTEPHGEFYAMTTQELFDLTVSLAEELSAIIAMESQSAVRDGETDTAPPLNTTRPASDPALSRTSDSASRETTSPQLAGLPATSDPWLRPFPDSVASLAPSSSASGPGREEPERDGGPVLYIWNHRVTSADVRRCLADSGDLADYDNGRISKLDAFERTRNWLREQMERQ